MVGADVPQKCRLDEGQVGAELPGDGPLQTMPRRRRRRQALPGDRREYLLTESRAQRMRQVSLLSI